MSLVESSKHKDVHVLLIMIERIQKYINGEGDDQERLNTIKWIKADTARVSAYHRLKGQSALTGISDEITDIHILSSYQKVKSQMVSRSINLKLVMNYAATIVLTFGIAWLAFLLRDYNSKQEFDQLTQTVVQTPPGQANIVTLPDGSKVWMNGDSRLSFKKDFTSTDRNVEFEGEGFFEITKDTLKEFNVITKGMIVQVHGTSFNLEAFSGEDIITTLVEGKVALQTPSGDMISYLKPGQQSVVQANGNSALITEVDTEQYTSWKNGYISFKNQSIGEIVPRLERLYNINIIIQNERVNKIYVSGKALKYSPVDHLFKAFELTYGIHYKLDVSIDKKSRLYIY